MSRYFGIVAVVNDIHPEVDRVYPRSSRDANSIVLVPRLKVEDEVFVSQCVAV